MAMEKWYQEDYTWTVEDIGYLRGNTPEGYCRNGEEIGDRYTCTYGCPVNQAGQGICSKVMGTLFPLMEAVRSGVARTHILDGRIPHSILIEVLSHAGIGTMIW